MVVDLPSGRAYAYTGGRALGSAGQPVLFLHGAQHDHSVWILQSRYLAHHGFRVLAADLPGHGRSEGPALSSIEAMAEWVASLLQATGLGPAVLCGHSMGSLIALQCAAAHPELAAGVALVGAAAPMKVSDGLLDAARSDEAQALDMINAWSHASIYSRPGCPGPGFSIFMQNRRLMERQAPGVLLTDFNACNAYDNAFEAAAALRCPALFVLGSRDLMTPPKAARALISAISQTAGQRDMPQPTVVEVAEAGHALMSERPDAVLAALRTFLEASRTRASARHA